MNIVLTDSQYNINNIYYGEPIQNTVMDNSKFIKILYSTEDIIMRKFYINILRMNLI